MFEHWIYMCVCVYEMGISGRSVMDSGVSTCVTTWPHADNSDTWAHIPPSVRVLQQSGECQWDELVDSV